MSLTDEQIDADTRALVMGESMPEENAWMIIAAVENRAARRERERIEGSLHALAYSKRETHNERFVQGIQYAGLAVTTNDYT